MRPSEHALVWVDLVDPDPEALDRAWPHPVDDEVRSMLCGPALAGDVPRPRFRTRPDSVAGVFLLPILTEDASEVVHQEIDLVLSADVILTVRKTPRLADGTPGDRAPYDPADLAELVERDPHVAPGRLACVVADDVAEAFLDLVDGLVDRIDDLEDRVEGGDRADVHRELSRFRHDLLHLRRIVTPTRDAVRRVVDGRVATDDAVLFPRELQLAFGDVYDKLLRAGESLETARELIGGVRDYVQAEIANDQNEVMKRLTAGASILLVPTFIVGLYGQNFIRMPELHWRYGYAYSWALIVGATLLQLWWFRRKKWI